MIARGSRVWVGLERGCGLSPRIEVCEGDGAGGGLGQVLF